MFLCYGVLFCDRCCKDCISFSYTIQRGIFADMASGIRNSKLLVAFISDEVTIL